MDNTIDKEQAQKLTEICKEAGIYAEWTSDNNIAFMIQGLDFAHLYWNGHSWNLKKVINNNRMDAIVKIQNILNNNN